MNETVVTRFVEVNGDDLWYSAYNHIVDFALPLIKRLRQASNVPRSFLPVDVYSLTGDEREQVIQDGLTEYHGVLDAIIKAFERISNDEQFCYPEEVQAGCELFGKHFQTLWD